MYESMAGRSRGGVATKLPDDGRQMSEEASVDGEGTGKDRRFTRLEAARMLGLSSVNAVVHRELRAGIVPESDDRGVKVYTQAQIDTMARVTNGAYGARKIGSSGGREDTEVQVARAVFQAFQDGKDSAEVVLMGLATPKQAASLAEQWAKMPPKLSRGGLGLSQDAVTKLVAMLGIEVVIKSEDDLVGAVAALVSRSKQNGARTVPFRTSNAIPKAWSQRPEQEVVEPSPAASVAADGEG
jgi:hypothetical protein